METGLEATNRAELERHKVEEESAVCFGGEADQLTSGLRRSCVKDVLKISCLTAETGTVVNDLAVDFPGCVVNKSHSSLIEETVNVFVRDAGERRVEIIILAGDLADHLGYLAGDLLAAEFDKPKTRALVEDDNKQEPAND